MGQTIEICVPDIGDFEDVEVVEILVSAGDTVDVDDPLVSVESDKATMEIPASEAGVVSEVRVSEGDRVSEGSVLVLLDAAGDAGGDAAEETASELADATPASSSDVKDTGVAAEAPAAPTPAESAAPEPAKEPAAAAAPAPATTEQDAEAEAPRPMSAAARDPVPDRPGVPHASPLVRRYARELGVPVETTEGSGPFGRVLVDDLNQRVRDRFAGEESAKPAAQAGGVVPAMPPVDHAAYGPVREEPLTRIQRVAGPALHRSWLNVPHVTQHDEADVTELERFRRARKGEAESRGVRLSPLLFVMKAVVPGPARAAKFRASSRPRATD